MQKVVKRHSLPAQLGNCIITVIVMLYVIWSYTAYSLCVN